jgi:hypothetical protein
MLKYYKKGISVVNLVRNSKKKIEFELKKSKTEAHKKICTFLHNLNKQEK